MNLVGPVAAANIKSENYLYTEPVDTSLIPEINEVNFHFGISSLVGDTTVDVEKFCSEDGVEWISMGPALNYNADNCPDGVYGKLHGHIQGGTRFQKFGFNVCG